MIGAMVILAIAVLVLLREIRKLRFQLRSLESQESATRANSAFARADHARLQVRVRNLEQFVPPDVSEIDRFRSRF